MTTAVTFTSIEAYRGIERNGSLTRQQTAILAVVDRSRDYSLQELVAITGMPVNVISGRVNELKASKHLEVAAQRRCSVTGRTINPVRLPAVAGEQGALFDA